LRWLFVVGVNQVFQFLAGLEVRDLLGGNLDPVTRFGIASDAGLALARAETPEAAYLNLVTGA
jgi:hypothetical protein